MNYIYNKYLKFNQLCKKKSRLSIYSVYYFLFYFAFHYKLYLLSSLDIRLDSVGSKIMIAIIN